MVEACSSKVIRHTKLYGKKIECLPPCTICYTMAAHAARRLQREYLAITLNPSTYYSVAHNPENILEWSANIHCLPDLRHSGKAYDLEIICHGDYPFRPPRIRFLTRVNSTCVDRHTGEINIDILKGQWSPSFTLSAIILSICTVLTDNEPTRPTRWSERLSAITN